MSIQVCVTFFFFRNITYNIAKKGRQKYWFSSTKEKKKEIGIKMKHRVWITPTLSVFGNIITDRPCFILKMYCVRKISLTKLKNILF